jgi:hypothetical protein
MRPIRDLTQALTMPLRALFVVGLCWAINAMTYNGVWWVQWVALGMGIATLVALARGLRTLVVLALVWWVGRELYKRYGQAAHDRFNAWVDRTQPRAAEVVRALRPQAMGGSAGDGFAAPEAAVRH